MEKQQNKEINIKNEVLIKTNGLDMDFWNSALYSSTIREKNKRWCWVCRYIFRLQFKRRKLV